jgi:hypothetical protein
MKKLVFLSLALMLLSGIAYAQPPGCSWEGDPAFRYGWGYLNGLPYNQPGPDYITAIAGQTLTYRLGPYNAHPTWTPTTCKNTDTLCFHISDNLGWTIACTPPADAPTILGAGYLFYEDVSITLPCNVTVGQIDEVIAVCAYTNIAGTCDVSCGDCNDPNVRPGDGLNYYSADTLYITVVVSPPALGIFQDSIYYVEQGQTQAYVPFTIANQDECAPPTLFNYNIVSKGHIGAAINQSGSVTVNGGEQQDVYGIINAGTAAICTYDTLTIIAWAGTAYDTCVQLVHVVSPVTVPLFTAPVVTILVLALVLAAAVFMRRRAVSRA